MNRIDRLLWEETHIRDIEKLKSHGSTFAKALWVALLVGLFALLMARPWPPSFYDARVQTSNEKWQAARSAAASKSPDELKPRPPKSVGGPSTPERGDRSEETR